MPLATAEAPYRHIGEYWQKVRDRSPEELSEEVGGWVLAGPDPSRLDDGEWSYRTHSARTVFERSSEGMVVLEENFVVYPLKKSPDKPFADRLHVGRASSNDICIPHGSVSKLHARIVFDDDGTPIIVDAGSTNGIRISGRTLDKGEERRLKSGTLISFGDCGLVLVDAELFVSLLKRVDWTPRARDDFAEDDDRF
jgi:hypothetical protein